MATRIDVFKPTATYPVAVNAATPALQIVRADSAARSTLHVYNPTPAIAFVAIGDKTVSASSAGSFPVEPGGKAFLLLSPLNTSVSVVLSAGSGTVYLTVGSGS